MKNSTWKGVILFVCLAMTVGCAGLPKNVPTKAQDQVSIPAASDVEKIFEKKGISSDKVSTSFFRLPLRVILAEDSGKGGQWSVVCMDIPTGEKIEGFYFWDRNNEAGRTWNIPIAMPILYGPLEKVRNKKCLSFSRDWLEVYDPWGDKAENYDHRRYEKDPEYARRLHRERGLTLSELDNKWRTFFMVNHKDVPAGESYAEEMTLQQYKAYTEAIFPTHAKSYDGQVRVTGFSQKEFEKLAAKNPAVTGPQKFIRRFSINPGIFQDYGVSAFGNALLGSMLDKTPEGYLGAANRTGWQEADRLEGYLQTTIVNTLVLRQNIVFEMRRLMIEKGLPEHVANEITHKVFQDY